MWKLKSETWEKICLDFNSTSGTIPRTSFGLKAKYDSIKKSLKKKVIKNKEESMKTGGGIPNFINIEGPEKDLLVVLDDQVHGLPSSNDCDIRLKNTDLTGMHQKDKEDAILENTNEEMTKLNYSLETSYDFPTVNSNDQEVIIEVVGENDSNADVDTEKKTSEVNWGKWTPGLLKRKKSGALTGTPNRKRFRKEDVGENVTNLMCERQSLVKLQTELLLKEEERKEREHAATMEKIQQEKVSIIKNDERAEREHLLRMNLLEIEIAIKKKILLTHK